MIKEVEKLNKKGNRKYTNIKFAKKIHAKHVQILMYKNIILYDIIIMCMAHDLF